MYPFSGLQKIDPLIVQNAAIRGTKVHKICEAIIMGLGEIGVDEQTFGYVDSFKSWWGEGKDVLYQEQRFWDEEYKLTGQVDLIINSEEGPIIIDFKTSSKPSKTWIAQASGYYHLAKKNNIHVNKILFIHLNKLGKPPKIYEYPCDESFFFAVFRVFLHFFHQE